MATSNTNTTDATVKYESDVGMYFVTTLNNNTSVRFSDYGVMLQWAKQNNYRLINALDGKEMTQ